MSTAPRYEIVDTIAAGDFATVYRGRDRELGRDVAVKAIHPHFLSNPRQLERYWREAQLLASLQHPHILTIYDIVRGRGWLILELMRGSLQESARTGPLDLDFLRVALTGCLHALDFLHTKGIVHGDIKPSNMLLDAQRRVKLGDFGLARRVTNESGSLLKGTTKYMAPELISSQFGPVGPASDLYSLGFSAYELMCGPQFESLFPGLSGFGRDPQIAWMMWHAAADRNLPEIGRVLEGVPEDLARVIQSLVVKDQSRRLATARDALGLLKSRPTEPASREPDAAAEAAAMAAARRQKRMRVGAIAAAVCSAVLSVVLLFVPLGGGSKPAAPKPPEPARGVIEKVLLDQRLLVVRGKDGQPKEVSLKPTDEVLINGVTQLPRDLQPGDEVTITVVRDASGRSIQRIDAARAMSASGRIREIAAQQGTFTLDCEPDHKLLVIRVPETLPITFNGQPQFEGRPVKLADLRADDRVELEHAGEPPASRVALKMSVQREVTMEGIARDVDAARGQLTVALGSGEKAPRVTLPFAPRCEVTINGRSELDDQLLKPADLKPGDRVTVTHDTRITRVDAYRVLGLAGVIQQVQYAAKTLDVILENQVKTTTFLVGPQCQITLSGEPAELGDLRAGDLVDIKHDTPDAASPRALSIAAVRPSNPQRWAIVVSVQQYDDASLTPLEHAAADGKLVADTLVRRFAVPKSQLLLLADPSQVRLEQGVPGLLKSVGADDTLVVYFVGHAYRDQEGTVYLAPKDFHFQKMSNSGVPLQWLLDQMEQGPAKEKWLLLDASHSGSGADLAAEPSTAEMLQSLKGPPGMAALRTVTGLASCSPGQRGAGLAAEQHGVFAWSLAQGLSGRADANKDSRLEPTELVAFLKQDMEPLSARAGQPQTPVLVLPNNTPPRLTEEAKKAIYQLAALLQQDNPDVAAVHEGYQAAKNLAGSEIEPSLLYGLLLLKTWQTIDAARFLEQLKIEHPDLLLPRQGLVWLRLQKRTYRAAAEELRDLVLRVPKPAAPDDPAAAAHGPLFRWMGQLREYADLMAQEKQEIPAEVLKQLDEAVAGCGPQAVAAYQQGRQQSREVAGKFDQQLAGASDHAAEVKLRWDRRQLSFYASFPFDDLAQEVLTTVKE